MTVVVDLTPVLPGGENGGAKPFALALVRDLARLAPDTRFVVLTQAAAHAELAVLDGPNVVRHQAVGEPGGGGGLLAWGASVARHLPGPLRALAGRAGYALHRAMKRGGGGLVKSLGGEALLCPFTAPTYAEAGIPVVCTLYDLQFRAYPEFFAPEDRAQRERAFADCCERATTIVAISEFSRAEAVAARPDIAAKAIAIPLRVEAEGGEGDAAVLGRLVLAPGRYFLYPANFWKHKNHEALLTAFGIAAQGGLPADFVLVCTGAPGARSEWLQDAARRMGLGERVRFPGFVPDAELVALRRGACAVVFPSLYEGFGLPVAEAMAAGVPVACSDRTALAEVAGDAALLFDPRKPADIAAALVRMATDVMLRERLVGKGRTLAPSRIGTEAVAARYLDLLG